MVVLAGADHGLLHSFLDTNLPLLFYLYAKISICSLMSGGICFTTSNRSLRFDASDHESVYIFRTLEKTNVLIVKSLRMTQWYE